MTFPILACMSPHFQYATIPAIVIGAMSFFEVQADTDKGSPDQIPSEQSGTARERDEGEGDVALFEMLN